MIARTNASAVLRLPANGQRYPEQHGNGSHNRQTLNPEGRQSSPEQSKDQTAQVRHDADPKRKLVGCRKLVPTEKSERA